jgi:hypothetical protein
MVGGVGDLNSYSNRAIVDHGKKGPFLLPRDVISVLIPAHRRQGEPESGVCAVNDRCDEPNLGRKECDPQ